MKRNLTLLLCAILALSLLVAGCSTTTNDSSTSTSAETSTSASAETSTSASAETSASDDAETSASDDAQTYLIGFSQCTMNHPYRVAMVEQNMQYAEENYPMFKIVNTDGQNDAAVQSQDVEDLLAMDIDLLIISPLTSDGLTDAVQEVMDAGIPVICLDRNVDCDVTCFIGTDNYKMGADSADKLAGMCDETATIIEVQGTAGASATVDRHDGFADTIAEKYPNMKVTDTQSCDYLAANAMSYMEDMLQKYGKGEITAIYCHNDAMASGVIEALEAAGRGDEGIIIIGMDGEEMAFDYIQEGKMAFTTVYPVCAPEGVIAAYDILCGDGAEATIATTPYVVDSSNVEQYIGTGLQ